MPERTIDPAQLASYTAHLRREERSPGTIEKYLRDIRAFAGWLDGRPVSRELVAEWRDHLLSKDYAPVTINSMLAALNGLFHFLGWDECRVKFLKVQRRLFRDAEPHPMRRERPFVDAQMAVHAIRDPGCVDPAHLTGSGQSRNHPVLLLCGQRSAVIIKSKQAAHYSSTSLSTGSLRYSRRSFRYWISSGSVMLAVKSDHDMAWSSESVR